VHFTGAFHPISVCFVQCCSTWSSPAPLKCSAFKRASLSFRGLSQLLKLNLHLMLQLKVDTWEVLSRLSNCQLQPNSERKTRVMHNTILTQEHKPETLWWTAPLVNMTKLQNRLSSQGLSDLNKTPQQEGQLSHLKLSPEVHVHNDPALCSL
jgi:hypothetical protein